MSKKRSDNKGRTIRRVVLVNKEEYKDLKKKSKFYKVSEGEIFRDGLGKIKLPPELF